MSESWLVYLIECSDSSYYCGITNNLDKRIKTHNSGKGAKYTRCRLPVKLLTRSRLMTKSQASKLEHLVKKQKRYYKIEYLTQWNYYDF